MFLFRGKKYFRLFIINLIIIIALTFFITYSIDRRIESQKKRIEKNLLYQLLLRREYENDDLLGQALNMDYRSRMDSILEKIEEGKINSYVKNSKIFTSRFKITLLIVFVVMAFIYFINFMIIKSLQNKYIKEIDRYISSLMNQEFDINLKEDDEGIVSNLNNRFNKLGLAIRRNYADMNRENIAIRDNIADISHQIKTPLAALAMYNEILSDSSNLSDEQLEFVDHSKKQIDRLRWLISSLLTLSKIDANTIKFNKQEFELSELSSNFETILMSQLKKKNLRLVEKGDLDKVVHLDLDWTREALLNVVKNATEHAFENTDIEIIYTSNISMVSIEVKNKGNTIDSKDITRIFDRFYKAKSSINFESVGIGLNLAKNIVESQGGSLTVYNMDRGVKFDFVFLK